MYSCMHPSVSPSMNLFTRVSILALRYFFIQFNFLFSCVKPLFYRCSHFTFFVSFAVLLSSSREIFVIHILIFQRFLSPPTIIVTLKHQGPERPQDSIAYWLEEQSKGSFKICYTETKIFAGLHKNIKMVRGLLNALKTNVVSKLLYEYDIKKIIPIVAINLQPSIATGQDCNGTGGFILAQESNIHNKKNRNPKFHDWSYVESGNSQCQSIRKKNEKKQKERLPWLPYSGVSKTSQHTNACSTLTENRIDYDKEQW